MKEYTIGEISKMFNLTISQLRFYDQNGLLPNLKRTNGIRKFSDKDIEALYLIECLKNSGLQIKEIKTFVEWTKEGNSTISKRYEFFIKQQEKIEKEISRLNETLDLVKYKCWYYKTAEEIGSLESFEKNIDNLMTPDIKKLYDSTLNKDRSIK